MSVNKRPFDHFVVLRLLVEDADILNLPLLYVYKNSMESGSVPKDWKKANVTAIFKKGEKSSPFNYRPVSWTSQVCKVLESPIRDNILEHVRKYNLIRNHSMDLL